MQNARDFRLAGMGEFLFIILVSPIAACWELEGNVTNESVAGTKKKSASTRERQQDLQGHGREPNDRWPFCCRAVDGVCDRAHF